MKSARVTLSLKGLGAVAALPRDSTFTFIVDNHKYECHPLFAAFLSPAVAQVRATDPLFDQLTLNIDDSQHQFEQFITIMRGSSVKVTEHNADYLFEVAQLLGNSDLQSKLLHYRNSELTPSNVISRIMQKEQCRVRCGTEITFAAQNFSKLSKSELKELPLETLRQILMEKKLVVKTETSLFKFIVELIKERGPEYRSLLSCILFENLGPKQMRTFADLICIDDIDTPLGESICGRFRGNNNDEKRHRYTKRTRQRTHERRLDYNGVPFTGVLDYLGHRAGGNVHQMGVVEISSSASGHNEPWQVAEFGWTEKWMSFNVPDSWIQFDFKKRRLLCTKYSLKTANWGPDANHIKSWVVETSRTGKEWTIIDQQTNNSDLNGRSLVRTFDARPGDPARFLRIRMTGKNHIGNDYLCLTNVEFFGILTE